MTNLPDDVFEFDVWPKTAAKLASKTIASFIGAEETPLEDEGKVEVRVEFKDVPVSANL